MQLHDLRKYCMSVLADVYDTSEAQAIVQVLLEDFLHYSASQLSSDRSAAVSDGQRDKVMSALHRLQQGEPLQYVLGHAWFMGLSLTVTPDVLIPRPETEELVALVVKENILPAPKILDICTGSGCIAVALKHLLPDAEVWAVDISDKALQIAKINALKVGDVHLVQADVLTENWYSVLPDHFDIIVSNPPYVAAHERDNLAPHVLHHEPHLALFVPDHDQLVFYNRILTYAITRQVAKTYFELNPLYADELLNRYAWDFPVSRILRDMSGNKRFGVFES